MKVRITTNMSDETPSAENHDQPLDTPAENSFGTQDETTYHQPDQSSSPELKTPETLVEVPAPISIPEPSVPSVPVITAAAPVAPPTTPAHPGTPAGVLVLQWLTYAFWGWTVLMVSILVATVLANTITGADTSGFTPYGIAAVLVLLPIAIACDVFFSKHEMAKKTGASSVIMVIHAVLFALFAVGSLIVAVFSLISKFTSSGDSADSSVALYSALVIFVLYGAALLRTINPVKYPAVRRFYPIGMAVCVGLITIFGFIGPVAHAHRTRDDKLIESSLPTVSDTINSYVDQNHHLPSSLSTLELSGSPDAQQLVTRNLVKYTPNTLTAKQNYDLSGSTQRPYGVSSLQSRTYYYQLCVNYKEASKYRTYGSTYNQDASGYSSYPSTYQHAAGSVCYKLTATDNGYNSVN
jgi:hypothetical protein